jgi:hypothetical protein
MQWKAESRKGKQKGSKREAKGKQKGEVISPYKSYV